MVRAGTVLVSDYHYLSFVASVSARITPPTPTPAYRWSPKRLEKPVTEPYIAGSTNGMLEYLPTDLNHAAGVLEDYLGGLCDASIPRSSPMPRKRSVH